MTDDVQDDRLADAMNDLPELEVPERFADRVMAARARGESAAPESRFALRRVVLGMSVVGAAAAFALWVVPKPVESGELIADVRTEAALADRGKIVAERGAELSWRVASGGARVEQARGNVFYRVDEGGSFVVDTGAGEVQVQGTCFRVEIRPMKDKTKLKAATIGAVLATTVVVTVYEGRVLFADKDDSGQARTREVAAGKSLTTRGSSGPAALAAGGAAEDGSDFALTQPPDDDASRDALLARDAKQRQEIATLRKRLAGGGGAQGPGGRGDKLDDDGRPWFDPSKGTLEAMAKECRMRYDMPPPINMPAAELGPKLAGKLGLSPEEGVALATIIEKVREAMKLEARQLYIEATGDVNGADSLSMQAMGQEITDKSAEHELSKVQRRLAGERAGLIRPRPAGQGSPLERYYRLMAGVGDAIEHELAAVIGNDRAREVRSEAGGWGSRMEIAGCPDDEERTEDADVMR